MSKIKFQSLVPAVGILWDKASNVPRMKREKNWVQGSYSRDLFYKELLFDADGTLETPVRILPTRKSWTSALLYVDS